MSERLTEVVRVRLTPSERRAFAAGRDSAMSESHAIRVLIRQGCALPLPVAAVDQAVLREAIDQLRRCGVNLNQAVRAMNEGRVNFEPRLMSALRTMITGVAGLQNEINGIVEISQFRRMPAHGV